MLTFFYRVALVGLLAASVLSASGCASDSYAAKGAVQGASVGAVSGAVGSMVGALVFGGNVVDAGVRGAVVGGSVGATAGAMSGTQRDKAEAERRAQAQQADIQRLRREIGDDAFNGVVALAECKHGIALANAQEARRSTNRDYQLAGLWVEIITRADERRESDARALFPDLISADKDIRNDQQAEEAMRRALTDLTSIRREYDLPLSCPA
ncbi:MAG: hypothetical protein QNJ73_12340 [Gammaproteobacteria bacterium]|nr:hypothetical protein [Gammaproteobacteria bacterium]